MQTVAYLCRQEGAGMVQPSTIAVFIYFILLFFYTICAFYGKLWAKGDHLMETSYLKAHPLGDRYPESGIKPMRSGIPRPPERKGFHCTSPALPWRG